MRRFQLYQQNIQKTRQFFWLQNAATSIVDSKFKKIWRQLSIFKYSLKLLTSKLDLLSFL